MNPETDQDASGFTEPSAPAWMTTFGDMMSLLLTFFVLLMSFATMDLRMFAAVVGSMRDAFGVQRQHPGVVDGLPPLVDFSQTGSSSFSARLAEREQALLRRLEIAVDEQGWERLVEVENTARGIVLRMPAQLLFDSGSSDLRPESLAPLREISKLVRGMPHPVAIEGHTDSVPVASGRFESNWDLSAARAVSTLRFLVDVGGIEASRLRATGFADSRPLVSNDTGERRALNRRVEIVFLKAPQEVAAAGAGRSGEAVESGGVSE